MPNTKLSRWMMSLALIAVAGAGLFTGRSAVAYPVPDPIPRGWSLDFYFDTPTILSVPQGEGEQPQYYLYMTYRVINRTRQDRLFVPKIDMITNTGNLIPAGYHVPKSVFEKIRWLERNPAMQDTTAVTGKVLVGRDNMKQGVAIFKLPGRDIDRFSILVSGLSSESDFIAWLDQKLVEITEEEARDLPSWMIFRRAGKVFKKTGTQPLKDADGNDTRILVQKSLMLSFTSPSNFDNTGRKPVKLISEQWVMR